MPIPKPRVQIVDPHRSGRAERNIQALEEDTLRRSRWHTYARASAFPRHHSEIVTEEWKAQNLGDLDAPWAPGLIDQNEITDTRIWLLSRQKRTATMNRSHVSCSSAGSIPLDRWRLTPCSIAHPHAESFRSSPRPPHRDDLLRCCVSRRCLDISHIRLDQRLPRLHLRRYYNAGHGYVELHLQAASIYLPCLYSRLIRRPLPLLHNLGRILLCTARSAVHAC